MKRWDALAFYRGYLQRKYKTIAELRRAYGGEVERFDDVAPPLRYDVVEVYSRATAQTATAFLDALLARMPFPIRALQIDGGSEFRGGFEAACAARGLPLFVIPPRSPTLQSHVERAHRTHREEFYEVWPVQPTLREHRAQLQAWAHVYNTIRPHQHLDYRTPSEVCQQYTTTRG